MITIKVRFLFHLKDAIGAREITLNLKENATIKDALQLLFKRYGDRIENILKKSDGEYNPSISILVNGRLIDFISGLETKLSNGDLISFVPLAGGG